MVGTSLLLLLLFSAATPGATGACTLHILLQFL